MALRISNTSGTFDLPKDFSTEIEDSPFKECRKAEFSASVNYQAKYTDMMLYTKPDEVSGIAA